MSEDVKVTLPAYLKQTDDGEYDITLRGKFKVDGVNVTALRMREPTVEDHLVMDATKGSDMVKEMTMFANLCGITITEIKGLGLHDYKRVTEAFANFIV